MKYDCSNLFEQREAIGYLQQLIEKKSIVEVKKISKNRSLSQNAYLHLLIGAFGQHFGFNMEEGKTLYKQLSKEVYSYDKMGRTFMKSSADLSTEEMAKTIDKFMAFSAEQGYPLPLATDKEWLMRISNETEKARHYL